MPERSRASTDEAGRERDKTSLVEPERSLPFGRRDRRIGAAARQVCLPCYGPGCFRVCVDCGLRGKPAGPGCLTPPNHVSPAGAAADTFLNEAFARYCNRIGNRRAAEPPFAAKTRGTACSCRSGTERVARWWRPSLWRCCWRRARTLPNPRANSAATARQRRDPRATLRSMSAISSTFPPTARICRPRPSKR